MRLKDFSIKDLVNELESRGMDLGSYNEIMNHPIKDVYPALYWTIMSVNVTNQDDKLAFLNNLYNHAPQNIIEIINEKLKV